MHQSDASAECNSTSWSKVLLLAMHMQAIMEAAQLKAGGKAQRVIVTGCLAQRYSQDLAGE